MGDGWTAVQLQAFWLNLALDLASINGHFDHNTAVLANTSAGVLTAADLLNATTDRRGALDFSVGCRSVLSLSNNQVAAKAKIHNTGNFGSLPELAVC